jgi:hypothetical protein
MVICRDQCGTIFLGLYHYHMSWLVICCCHCGRSFCFVGKEECSDFVDSVDSVDSVDYVSVFLLFG